MPPVKSWKFTRPSVRSLISAMPAVIPVTQSELAGAIVAIFKRRK